MINLPNAATLPPNAPAIYDARGNLNFDGWGDQNNFARYLYPFSGLKQPYSSQTNFLNSNLVVAYRPLKGFQLSTSLGYNNAQANNQLLKLIASQDPVDNPTGENQLGYNTNKNWIIEPQANYETLLGSGKFSILIGSSLQATTTDGIRNTGSGYTSDDLINSISNAPRQTTTDLHGQYKYAAIYGRISYNWKNKYLLNLNARRDGSSRFGEGKQYGNFGSIGASWIFSEEEFFKNFVSFISFGKLRVSYGTTGSDAIGDYQYLTQWSSTLTRPYNGISALSPTLHANPGFQWQVNRKLEGALDLGFFKDRLNINIAYYRNRCGNQLVSFPTPAFSGFTGVTANSPALVQNSGWEFNASSSLIRKQKFSLSVNLNGAINHNKLIAYPNIEKSPYADKLVVGEPLNIVRVLRYLGINPENGEQLVDDKNHDGQILWNPTDTADDSYPYNLSPKFLGGFGINISFNKLEVNLFFTAKKQTGRNAYKGIPFAGAYGNQPVELLGHQWQKPGDKATYAKFTTQLNQGGFDYSFSDGFYTDASYIRLSNLSVSYSLPDSWVKE